MKQKIVSVVPYATLPCFSGGQKCIAQFNEYMGLQCELTVVSTSKNDLSLVKNYTLLPWMKNGKLKFFQLPLFFQLASFIKKNNIQYLMIEHPYMGWLGCLLRWQCKIPLVVHTYNIEYLRFKSVGKKWWPILMWYEKKILNAADIVFCISQEDMEYMIGNIGIDEGKCHVITFGTPLSSTPTDKADCAALVRKQHNIKNTEAIILFNGLLSYKPNAQAVLDILNCINPILLKYPAFEYKIIICGKDLPAELNGLQDYANKNIIYMGFVPDIELYFKAADIFINPILSGGGIKTKLVEALGFNTTVVSAATGAIGCDKTASGNKLIVVPDNDWAGFAEAIINQLSQPTPTPASFYKEYYWGNITKKAFNILFN
ncbi:glycosyltransferase family 4 protein [Parasediminibacterium sp. JCM 36343]|uniref:glycosyltransferase family 4 protein n=1 Tax=Parasediminibacterium sp. JCM 36343 TaxID=3374279 RepID=UPI00397DE846